MAGSTNAGAQRAKRVVRRCLSRAAAAAAIVIVVVGLLRGGTRYFFCPAMSAVMATSCCSTGTPHDEADESGDAPLVEQPACCRAQQVPATPSSAPGASTPDAPLAPITAILPPRVVEARAAARPAFGRGEQRVRAPPSASERRAELMVFLS